ncbi:MAG: YbaB/EbfC family nucleoid-associated protein, partial [Clostridia bacterium]|nr:YbaB/EbfC family nucleoid-associated protein [Clostridia bacterium]
MNQSRNVSNVVKQAQKMQEEMEKVQSEIEEKTVEATAGGGMVTVTANGKKEILSLKINPEAVDPEDVETLEDLVM